MKAQLIGLPQKAHRRLKEDISAWATQFEPDHSLRLTPSHDEWIPAIGAGELRDMRKNAGEGYVHLFLVPMRKAQLVQKEFHFDCRVVRLDCEGELLTLAWQSLRQALERCWEFEQGWRQRILPSDLRHPLLLPPPSFEPERGLDGFWARCDVYKDLRLLDEAHDLLSRVRAAHRRAGQGAAGYWQDARSLQYRIDPSFHGKAPRRHRFCYEVPAGFHYDVVHALERKFSLLDFSGTVYTGDHLNVDSWGHVRD